MNVYILIPAVRIGTLPFSRVSAVAIEKFYLYIPTVRTCMTMLYFLLHVNHSHCITAKARYFVKQEREIEGMLC